jgi:hypothetical protein
VPGAHTLHHASRSTWAKRGTPCYTAPELFSEGATHATPLPTTGCSYDQTLSMTRCCSVPLVCPGQARDTLLYGL